MRSVYKRLWMSMLVVTIFGSFLLSDAHALPTENLVLYFSFDGDSGGQVKNLSKEGNNGTLEGGASIEDGGQYGKGLALNGVDGFVLVPTNDSLQIQDAVTIMAWCMYDGQGDGWQAIMANGQQNGPWENYGMFINRGDNFLYFTILLNDEHTSHSSPGQPDGIQPGQWLHAAASYDSDTARIYLNGELIHEEQRGGPMSTTDVDLRIGHREGSGHFFSGVMDDVAIFNTALTEEEIAGAMGGLQDVLAVGKPSESLLTLWGNIKK